MLEQIAYEVSKVQERQTIYQVGDLESLSAVALYYGSGGGFGGGGFGGAITTSKGFIVPLGNLGIPELKDVHETYKIGKDGNLSGGHTTYVSREGTKRISND